MSDQSKSTSESLMSWYQANNRTVSIVGGLVLVAAVSAWFYMRSAEIKRLNAERGLSQARQSLGAGNPALAMTDLQKVAARYVGTPAGASAAMLLAQLNYDQAKHADGLLALAPYQSSSAAGPSLPDVAKIIPFPNTGDGVTQPLIPDTFQRAAPVAGS